MARRRGMTETVVGIFVLASILLLLALVIFIGRQRNIFEGRYQINGFFNSVGGLQPGADVQLAGISVGHVKYISFGPDNRVKVVMSIAENQQQRVRADSVASIRTFGLMGDRYVAITVGTEKEPIIPPGGIIKTQEIIELADAIEAARPALDNVQNTIQNISNLTDRLASPDSDVATTLRNIKEMTTNIREGEGTIGALVQRDELYQKANDVLDSTKQTMENFQTVSKNIEGASSDLPLVMEDLKSSVDKIETFSVKASAAATEIYQLAGSGASVMDDAKAITGNLKEASEDIKQATPGLAPLVESADKGVAEAKEVVDAAKRSWFLRKSLEPPAPAGAIIAGERDIARPEVIQ